MLLVEATSFPNVVSRELWQQLPLHQKRTLFVSNPLYGRLDDPHSTDDLSVLRKMRVVRIV